MAQALAALGHPERAIPVLHIAGTNGKGSTAAFAASLLQRAGARTGLYTSPHLSRFTERICIDGVEIAPERVAELVDRVLRLRELELTFFEVATAVAWLHFAREQVDLAVVEVGLGGRLDATNLCHPFATVITSIGLEHTEQLGPTTAAIAGEKAGIAKRGVPICTGPVDESAARAIAKRARSAGALLLRWGEEFEGSLERAQFSYRGPGGSLDGVRLALDGEHQRVNAALALAASSFAPGIAWDDLLRRHGLASTRWPARLERIAPHLLLDSAHNPAGAEALAAALPAEPFVLLIGVLSDKDVAGILAPLLGRGPSRLVCTRPASPRAVSADDLARRARELLPQLPIMPIEGVPRALEEASQSGELVICCGSIYLVAEVRRLVTGEVSDPVAIADPFSRR